MGAREASAAAARVGAAEAEGRCAGEAARVRAREGEESKVSELKIGSDAMSTPLPTQRRRQGRRKPSGDPVTPPAPPQRLYQQLHAADQGTILLVADERGENWRLYCSECRCKWEVETHMGLPQGRLGPDFVAYRPEDAE
jgi:hypothetical protein